MVSMWGCCSSCSAAVDMCPNPRTWVGCDRQWIVLKEQVSDLARGGRAPWTRTERLRFRLRHVPQRDTDRSLSNLGRVITSCRNGKRSVVAVAVAETAPAGVVTEPGMKGLLVSAEAREIYLCLRAYLLGPDA
jgi:hypothetical protein